MKQYGKVKQVLTTFISFVPNPTEILSVGTDLCFRLNRIYEYFRNFGEIKEDFLVQLGL